MSKHQNPEDKNNHTPETESGKEQSTKYKLEESVKAIEEAAKAAAVAEAEAARLAAEQKEAEAEAKRQEAEAARRRQQEALQQAQADLLEADFIQLGKKFANTALQVEKDAAAGDITTPKEVDAYFKAHDSELNKLESSLYDFGNPAIMVAAWSAKMALETKKASLSSEVESRQNAAEEAVAKLAEVGVADVQVDEKHTVADVIIEQIYRHGGDAEETYEEAVTRYQKVEEEPVSAPKPEPQAAEEPTKTPEPVTETKSEPAESTTPPRERYTTATAWQEANKVFGLEANRVVANIAGKTDSLGSLLVEGLLEHQNPEQAAKYVAGKLERIEKYFSGSVDYSPEIARVGQYARGELEVEEPGVETKTPLEDEEKYKQAVEGYKNAQAYKEAIDKFEQAVGPEAAQTKATYGEKMTDEEVVELVKKMQQPSATEPLKIEGTATVVSETITSSPDKHEGTTRQKARHKQKPKPVVSTTPPVETTKSEPVAPQPKATEAPKPSTPETKLAQHTEAVTPKIEKELSPEAIKWAKTIEESGGMALGGKWTLPEATALKEAGHFAPYESEIEQGYTNHGLKGPLQKNVQAEFPVFPDHQVALTVRNSRDGTKADPLNNEYHWIVVDRDKDGNTKLKVVWQPDESRQPQDARLHGETGLKALSLEIVLPENSNPQELLRLIKQNPELSLDIVRATYGDKFAEIFKSGLHDTQGKYRVIELLPTEGDKREVGKQLESKRTKPDKAEYLKAISEEVNAKFEPRKHETPTTQPSDEVAPSLAEAGGPPKPPEKPPVPRTPEEPKDDPEKKRRQKEAESVATEYLKLQADQLHQILDEVEQSPQLAEKRDQIVPGIQTQSADRSDDQIAMLMLKAIEQHQQLHSQLQPENLSDEQKQKLEDQQASTAVRIMAYRNILADRTRAQIENFPDDFWRNAARTDLEFAQQLSAGTARPKDYANHLVIGIAKRTMREDPTRAIPPEKEIALFQEALNKRYNTEVDVAALHERANQEILEDILHSATPQEQDEFNQYLARYERRKFQIDSEEFHGLAPDLQNEIIKLAETYRSYDYHQLETRMSEWVTLNVPLTPDGQIDPTHLLDLTSLNGAEYAAILAIREELFAREVGSVESGQLNIDSTKRIYQEILNLKEKLLNKGSLKEDEQLRLRYLGETIAWMRDMQVLDETTVQKLNKAREKAVEEEARIIQPEITVEDKDLPPDQPDVPKLETPPIVPIPEDEEKERKPSQAEIDQAIAQYEANKARLEQEFNEAQRIADELRRQHESGARISRAELANAEERAAASMRAVMNFYQGDPRNVHPSTRNLEELLGLEHDEESKFEFDKYREKPEKYIQERKEQMLALIRQLASQELPYSQQDPYIRGEIQRLISKTKLSKKDKELLIQQGMDKAKIAEIEKQINSHKEYLNLYADRLRQAQDVSWTFKKAGGLAELGNAYSNANWNDMGELLGLEFEIKRPNSEISETIKVMDEVYNFQDMLKVSISLEDAILKLKSASGNEVKIELVTRLQKDVLAVIQAKANGKQIEWHWDTNLLSEDILINLDNYLKPSAKNKDQTTTITDGDGNESKVKVIDLDYQKLLTKLRQPDAANPNRIGLRFSASEAEDREKGLISQAAATFVQWSGIASSHNVDIFAGGYFSRRVINMEATLTDYANRVYPGTEHLVSNLRILGKHNEGAALTQTGLDMTAEDFSSFTKELGIKVKQRILGKVGDNALPLTQVYFERTDKDAQGKYQAEKLSTAAQTYRFKDEAASIHFHDVTKQLDEFRKAVVGGADSYLRSPSLEKVEKLAQLGLWFKSKDQQSQENFRGDLIASYLEFVQYQPSLTRFPTIKIYTDSRTGEKIRKLERHRSMAEEAYGQGIGGVSSNKEIYWTLSEFAKSRLITERVRMELERRVFAITGGEPEMPLTTLFFNAKVQSWLKDNINKDLVLKKPTQALGILALISIIFGGGFLADVLMGALKDSLAEQGMKISSGGKA